MNIPQFQQCNVSLVLVRANELLTNMQQLQMGLDLQQSAAEKMLQDEDVKMDMWEHASWTLALVELTERIIRRDDPTVEKSHNLNGGFAI